MQIEDAAKSPRGWVTRQLVAEDARWAMDLVLSCQESHSASNHILIFGHHLVRIAYEGALAIRSKRADIGVPKFAALLEDKFARLTAHTRHTSKILDHTGSSYRALIEDLATVQRNQTDRFTGKAHRWLRWLERDLGLYKHQSSIVGATVCSAYRLGFDITEGAEVSMDDLRGAVNEWGGTLAVLGAANLDISEASQTIDFDKRPRVRAVDELSDRYLTHRYHKDFSTGLKLLVLMIEGDLNTARLLLPRTSVRHEMAVFRAQVITAYHALNSLRTIARENLTDSSSERQLRLLLEDEVTKRILSSSGKRIRNRCFHYPILNQNFEPSNSLPMYGIIESVAPGTTWESFNRDVANAMNRAADFLHDWKPELQ